MTLENVVFSIGSSRLDSSGFFDPFSSFVDLVEIKLAKIEYQVQY
jgi:hypothetical protein